MEKFEIMKIIQEVVDSLPNDMNHTKGKLEELNTQLKDSSSIGVVFHPDAYLTNSLREKTLKYDYDMHMSQLIPNKEVALC